MKAHPDLFTKHASKGLKAFKRMAFVIKTRTPIQCRTHHQKMVLKRNTTHKLKSMKKSMPNEANTVEIDIEEDQSAEVSMGRTEKHYAAKLKTSLNEPNLPDTEVRLIDYGAHMEDWMNIEPQENDFVIGDWGVRIPRTF